MACGAVAAKAFIFSYSALFGFAALRSSSENPRTPVVTAAGGATEEVAGGAAVLVDTRDPAAIAAGIEEADARRDELRGRGLERATRFTWERVAAETRAVYEEAAA